MKAVKSIGLFFAMSIVFFVIGYLAGMETTLHQMRRIEPDLQEEETAEMPQAKEEFKEFLDVSSNSKYLRSDTELVVEEVDVRSGTATEVIGILPEKYVGMDLDGFRETIAQYNLSPPLSERQRGFQSAEVLRFSRDRVVVQKNYRRVSPEEGFYLALSDYRVVVLLEDKKSLYMTTDISLNMLPEAIQQELMDMIYVENEAGLYDFLEAYSS